MTIGRACAISFSIVFVCMVGLLLWGFMSGSSVHLPLFLDVTKGTTADGKPQSELSFSPIGPILVALVLSAAIWAGTHLAARSLRSTT